ncbi:MAG: HAD family hydrolase [Ruminococcus sp.]|nr:HAD family hydrolase [Ruminococcus sp.]
MIRLIATDMDGTLLDAEKNLPRALPQLLQELYRRDIVFAIASGRSRIALTSLFGDLAASLIFICDNGGYIQIPGQAPLLHSMQPEAVHTVLDLCRQLHQVVPVLCCQHDIYYPQSAQEQFQNEINNFYKQFQHCPYEALYDIAKQDPVLKIALCDMAGPMQNSFPALQKEFGNSMNLLVSGNCWMDVMPAGIDKGMGIRTLQNHLGISPEETMTFGDFYNDVAMFQASAYSYAMENAEEGVKQQARFLAPPNTENGVLRTICRELEIVL